MQNNVKPFCCSNLMLKLLCEPVYPVLRYDNLCSTIMQYLFMQYNPALLEFVWHNKFVVIFASPRVLGRSVLDYRLVTVGTKL